MDQMENSQEKSRRKVFGLSGLIVLGMVAAFAIGLSVQGAVFASPVAQGQKGDTTQASTDKAKSSQLTDLFMTNFTTRLGVTEANLNAALTSALTDTASQALSSGLATQDEVDGALKVAEGGFRSLIGGLGGKVIMQRSEDEGFNPKIALITAAAKIVGLTEDQLLAELTSGKSFTDVATAHNVTAQALKDAILAEIRSQADAAVKAGKTTQDKADSLYQDFSSHIGDIISGIPNSKK